MEFVRWERKFECIEMWEEGNYWNVYQFVSEKEGLGCSELFRMVEKGWSLQSYVKWEGKIGMFINLCVGGNGWDVQNFIGWEGRHGVSRIL